MTNHLLNVIIPCNESGYVLTYDGGYSFKKTLQCDQKISQLSTLVQDAAKSFFEQCVQDWCVPMSHLAFGARSIYAARRIGTTNPWLGSLRMFEGVVLVADGWLRIRNGAQEFSRVCQMQAIDLTEIVRSLVQMGVGVASVVSGLVSLVVTTILLAVRTAVAVSFALARLLYGVSVAVALVQLVRIATHLYNLIEITKFSNQWKREAKDNPLVALTNLREHYLALNWEQRAAGEVADEFYKKSRELSEYVSDPSLCDAIQLSAGIDEAGAKDLLNKIFFNTTKHRVEEMMRLLFSIAHLAVNLLALVGGPLITMTYAIIYASCSAFLWVLVDMGPLRNAISDSITTLFLNWGLVYQIQEDKKISLVIV